VRQESEEDLAELKRQGVDWIRSIVWFSNRAVGPIVFVAGKDSDRAASNVALLGEDLARAKIGDWIVAFGPQGINNPGCRKQSWGDCFDAESIDQSIAFILDVRKGLDSRPHPRIWIDLENEGCARPEGGPQIQRLRETHEAYLTRLLPAYHAAYPDDSVTVSCSGDNQLQGRFEEVSKIFATAGIKPQFLDAHIYDRPDRNVTDSARVLAEQARTWHLPFVVGETNVARPDVEEALEKGFAEAGAKPEAIIHWPLTSASTACAADHRESIE
jgi:hypothetical protein